MFVARVGSMFMFALLPLVHASAARAQTPNNGVAAQPSPSPPAAGPAAPPAQLLAPAQAPAIPQPAPPPNYGPPMYAPPAPTTVQNSPPAYPPPAPAYSPAPPTGVARARAETNWSLGAGIGYPMMGYGFGYSSSTTSIGGSGSVAVGGVRTSVFLERRLFGHCFLLFQPTVDYTKFNRDRSADTGSSSVYADHMTSVHAAAGLRWVANPGELVEVGFAHLVDVGANYDTGSGLRYRSPPYTEAIHADAAETITDLGFSTSFVAERELVAQLWLRLNVALFRVSYAKSRLKYSYQDGTSESHDTSGAVVSLLAMPLLELRLTW